MRLFELQNYRACLKEAITLQGGIPNYKTQLARAAGCQLSYLSQVFSEKAELTPDHAAGIAQFWGLSKNETKYFLMLVHKDRAATPTLKRLYQEELEEMRKTQSALSNKIEKKDTLKLDQQMVYHSSWILPAIHLLCLVPKANTAPEISKRLNLPLETVLKGLTALEEIGLLKKKGGEWQTILKAIHLPPTLFASNAHIHWRQKAIQTIQSGLVEELHYSAVFAISKKDGEKIKQLLMDQIVSLRKIVDPSPEEEVYSFLCDFYPITKSQ